jgi:hypothetical protein
MRSFIAGLALLLAGLIGTAALGAYIAHRTVLDPERAGEVLAAGLEQPELRRMILTRAVPGYVRVPQEGRAALDRLAETSQLDRALRSVRLSADGTVSLAPLRNELTQALRDNGQTELAARIATAGGPDAVDVPARIFDRYERARDVTWLVATRGALAAVVLFLVALVVSANRRVTVRSIGVTILLSCGVVALLYWVSPELAHAASASPWVDAAAAVRQSQTSTALGILLPVAAAGVVLVIGSFFLPKPHRGPARSGVS